MPTTVVLVEPDPRWPEAFRAERRRLGGALAPYSLAVEHIGSTAVPGLPARPTVDILLGLYRLSDAPRVVRRMGDLGYLYLPKYEDVLPERRFFRAPSDTAARAVFHVHAAEVASAFFERHVVFRDWLRTHSQDRDAYARLKREAAARFPDDRGAYTDAKAPFIRGVEGKARAAAAAGGKPKAHGAANPPPPGEV
ncbi:MAG TPA: GrpB family protein [Candidatus Thermoplasmatota archaeon]